MGRSLRFICVAAVLATGAMTASSVPAMAQFFNPFEALFGPPPRPPSGVPGGRQPAPPASYPQYQDQNYPNQSNVPRQAPAAGVQSEPLAPPPGGASASVEPLSTLPPGQRPRGTPQPGDTSPQPGDEVIPEPPAQKIENKGALFSGLDKITGRIITFDAGIGETVQFGALQVTPRVCYTRPPTDTPNTDAFIEVDEVTLQGQVKRIFTGWVFAASPGLHGVEHPIYDVWLTDCKNPVVAAATPLEPPAPAVAPAPAPPKPVAAPRRPSQQPRAFPQLVQPR
jgi:hypothetical protein